MGMVFVSDSVISEKPKPLIVDREKPLDLDSVLKLGRSAGENLPRVIAEMKTVQSLAEISPEFVSFESCAPSEYKFVSFGKLFRELSVRNRFKIKGFEGSISGPIAYFDSCIAATLLSEPEHRTLWWWHAKKITSLVFIGTLYRDPATKDFFVVRIRLLGGEWIAERLYFSGFVSGEDHIVFR